ncbi:hypothetical protein BKA15_002268 [Microlunatus parietis]|uniref:Uncharacterized protein n=1 Tax=Microlunatus parietis TaxID=682979 RepID=A0A7Y9I712_9ACTN|nr:hypothetical protein [Microlunatus parietis]
MMSPAKPPDVSTIMIDMRSSGISTSALDHQY